MVETILLIILAVTIIGFLSYSKKQYAKGADDLFQLFAQSAYTQKVTQFEALNKKALQGGTVFLGDSITQDYNVYEFFKGFNVYNRGIGGDTSEGVLRRLNESVYQIKPNKVFLLIGTNDLVSSSFSLDKTIQNIKEIVQNIHAYNPSLKIYLLSILPVNDTIDKTTVGPRKNDIIIKINHELKKIKAVKYVDMFINLLGSDHLLDRKFTIEGLHLNHQGYEVMTDCILPLMHE